MAGLILKRPSPFAYPGGSPGFNPTHPASSGCTLSVAGVGPGGAANNLLSGKPPTTLTSAASKIDALLGSVVACSTTEVRYSGPNSNGSNVTVAAILNWTSGGNFLATHTGTSGVHIAINGSNIAFGNPGSSTSTPTGLGLVAGNSYFIVASSNGTTVNVLALNLRTGAITTATASGSGFVATGNGNYRLGCDWNGPSSFAGNIAAMMVCSQYTSIQQMLSWAKDPWAFWYPQKLDLWSMIKAAVGGTVNPRTLTATCTSTATLTKTAAFLRTLTATATSTATLIRTVSKTFAATCTSTSTLIRSIAKKLTATCTTSVVGTAIKVILKTLTATCTSTASLVTNSTFARTVTATCTSTAALIRRINKTLTATATSTSTLAKGFAKTLTATCTSTASVVVYKGIQTAKTLIAVCTTSGLVSTIKTLAGSVASLASKLRPYKPLPPPVIPGNDVLFLLNELQKVSNAFNAHVQATKDLDARLKAAGF